MKQLIIYCDEHDFSPLAAAFCGQFDSNCNLSCEIMICDEEEIRRLNREMRGIDSITDVLSFPSLDGISGVKIDIDNYPADLDEQGNLFIGSIAICNQRAKEQAEEYGHSFSRELNYLAAHGICHLLGYDHMEEADKKAMRTVEECVLAKMGETR